MEVGPPAEPRHHLFVSVKDRSLFRGALSGDLVEVRHLFCVVETQFQSGVIGDHEDLGDLTVHWADAGGVDDYQSLKAVLVHGGHLSGDPATDGVSNQNVVLNAKFLDQILGEVGNVVDGIEPVRTRRAKEAGVGRRVYGELLG